MKASELRNAVLQLAVQGKLVKQDESDEPASVLLGRIKVEKERLVREGKIKKDKPLPEITEEEKPFEIPDSWEWVRLGDIFKFIDYRGKTPTKIVKGIPLITASNVKNGYMDYCKRDFICESEYRQRQSRGISKKGDLLFTTEAPLANIAVADLEVYSAGQRIITFQNYGFLINKFFMYSLLSDLLKKVIISKSTGTTARGIKSEKLIQITIPFPPLAEQQRIVSKIDEIMPKIDEYEKFEQELSTLEKTFPENLKKAILQFAVQGKLVGQSSKDELASVLLEKIKAEKERLVKEGKIKREKPLPDITEDEKSFEIPESWEWVRLGETVQINPRNKIDDNEIVSFIPMALIKDEYSNSHSFEKRSWKEIKSGFTHFAENDIGIAKITPCFENRKSVVFRNLENGYGAGTTELHILRTYENTIEPLFLLWFVKTQKFINDGRATYTGTAGQQRISKDFILNYPIALPPIEEQRRIIRRIEELLLLCINILIG